jgi:hypothetical protein
MAFPEPRLARLRASASRVEPGRAASCVRRRRRHQPSPGLLQRPRRRQRPPDAGSPRSPARLVAGRKGARLRKGGRGPPAGRRRVRCKRTAATPRTVSSRQADSPSWSPVGGLIAFARFLGRAVRVVRPDGSGERVIDALTGRRVVWSAPLWSPNGQLVAFTEGPLDSGGVRFKSSIVVPRRDGGGRRVVVRRFASQGSKPLHGARLSRCRPLDALRVRGGDSDALASRCHRSPHARGRVFRPARAGFAARSRRSGGAGPAARPRSPRRHAVPTSATPGSR